MRKIGILMLVVFAIILSNQAFGFFENKVYCDFSDGNVTVFLKDEGGKIKCQTYLDSIYQLALKKYNEISTIRSYIKQGGDTYYWRVVLEQKKSELVQLVNYRVQVKTALDKFESVLFDRYYGILEGPMREYYVELEEEYNKIVSNNGGEVDPYNLRLKKIEQQMWNVSHILNAQKLDEILEVCSSYLYIKNRLGGK